MILKDLKVEPEIMRLLTMENLCQTYHCLPKDILEQDLYYVNALISILRGKQTGMDSRGKK